MDGRAGRPPTDGRMGGQTDNSADFLLDCIDFLLNSIDCQGKWRWMDGSIDFLSKSISLLSNSIDFLLVLY